MKNEVLNYYSHPGLITKLEKHHDFLDWVINEPRAIFQVIQGLLIHDLWLKDYGIKMEEKQICRQETPYMEDLLNKAVSLDSRSFAIPRSPETRVICCCREFATLMCAILRYKGIPARSRCGFARYFDNYKSFEDHWICEYWDKEKEDWIMVDPQIDPLQQSTIKMKANPLNLEKTDFVTAGTAWKICRENLYLPENFGINCDPKIFGLENLYGLWFIRGNLLRDFAALNKIEVVPFLVRLDKDLNWNSWELLAKKDKEITHNELLLLDKIAELTINPDTNFEQIQELFNNDKRLQPPEEITSRNKLQI